MPMYEIVVEVTKTKKYYIKAKDVTDKGKNVVLYHGTVDRSETDLGFKLPSKVKMKMFKDYDLALLGDIHKRQFINKEEFSISSRIFQQVYPRLYQRHDLPYLVHI